MKFLVRNSKKWQFKKKKSVSYPIIYIGLIQARQYLKPIHNICYKWYGSLLSNIELPKGKVPNCKLSKNTDFLKH